MNRKDSQADLRSAVKNLSIFDGASDAALDELGSIARCHDYPKNNILFYQGDPPGSAFLVISGRVKIALMNEEGREVVLNIVRPGGIFGLIAALDGGPQPANAITTEPSRLAKFSIEEFTAWVERQKLTHSVFLRELGLRIREAYQKIGEHALMGVKERLLYALLDIAEREGQPAPEGEHIMFTRPTHQELANRIGSSREVVSRLLKELLESDLLQAEGRVIRVSESALVLRED
jgi:CRP/FNR family transcriptional regulator/CRP/FNR family cyclic AMP-dependent transcriptional regulator